MLYRTLRELKNGIGLTMAMVPEGDGGSGGGSGDGKGSAAPDHAKEIADLKAEIAALRASNPPPKKEEEDPTLQDKARKERDARDKEGARTKQLESSIRFNMQSADFLKKNETLLPKDVADIFSQAEKENFADPIEKDSAIKAGLVQSFFSVQANADLLTAGQKATLDDYLKLTKNGKQEKAQAMYDMVFEPAFEMLKRVKRAEALSKGYGGGSDSEDSYKKKLMELSKNHYLRAKK